MSAFAANHEVIGPNPLGVRGEATQINANPSGTKLVYGADRTVIVRDFANPALCLHYAQHKKKVTTVKFTHEGNKLAAADASGALHFLDVKKSGLIEQTKAMSGLGGAILDLNYFENDKKLVIGGESKPSGRCITVSGLDQGSMTESSKRVLNVDVRPTKSAITSASASYDGLVRFYTGAAPKFGKTIPITKDKKPVQAVRYSLDGNLFAAAAGKEIKLFNGETGDLVAELPVEHKGSVYALSWSRETNSLMSCSADGTVKLWDAAAGKLVSSIDCGTSSEKVQNFQVGCCFAGETMVALSLGGVITYLDKSTNKVASVVEAHNGHVKAMSYGSEGLYTFDSVGGIRSYNDEHKPKAVKSSNDKPLFSKGGVRMSVHDGKIIGTSLEDVVKIATADGNEVASRPLKSACRDMAVAADGTAVVATKDLVFIISGDTISEPEEIKKDIKAIGISPDGKTVFIGGGDKLVHMYELNGTSLKALGKCVTDNKFDSDVASIDVSAKWVAIGLQTKKVKVYDRNNDLKMVDKNRMAFNTQRISSVKISPNQEYIATAGSDGSSYVYKIENPKERCEFPNIHIGGVGDVAWLKNSRIYTCGLSDAVVKNFAVEFK